MIRMTNSIEVSTGAAPTPAGHYAQAVVVGELMFVSGQLPIRPDGVILSDAPFDAQVDQAIANLFAIVEAGGSSPRKVVRTTAYVVGVERWGALNARYAAAFGSHRPARSIVPVPELHHGCLIEIDGVASL